MAGLGNAGNGGRLRRLRGATIMAVLAWTLMVAASLGWNVYNTWDNARDLAAREARTHFSKDQAFRYWASRHGGVYVEATESTPPNPALAHVQERDLTTPSGRHLTLMNPAYMMRQLMEDFGAQYGVRGRITSLKPLNPRNAPDPWETMALRQFDGGAREVFEVADKDGAPHLRLMRAMMTEESCLKCHAVQGYQVGQVRGGVGVAVPLAPYLNVAGKSIAIQAVSHGAIWLLGLAGIAESARRFRRHALAEMNEQGRAAQLHHRLELVLGAVSDGIIGIDAVGVVRLVNRRRRPCWATRAANCWVATCTGPCTLSTGTTTCAPTTAARPCWPCVRGEPTSGSASCSAARTAVCCRWRWCARRSTRRGSRWAPWWCSATSRSGWRRSGAART